MTHPEDLLADYVDGTLDASGRAVVDAHLPTCASCTEEIALAREAVAALSALQDEPVPFGVTGPVLAEAGQRFERRREVLWERLQWAAGLAAAAAFVLVVALNISGGGEPGVDAARGQTPAADGVAEAPVAGGTQETAASFAFEGLEVQADVNYVADGIHSLAIDAAGVLSGKATLGAEGGATFAQADEALACLRESGAPTTGDPRDTLMRLIEAEYEGTPAYIAVYAEGPGAGQPADTVVVWAVAKAGCRILTTASLGV
jgi:hypothetical protein